MCRNVEFELAAIAARLREEEGEAAARRCLAPTREMIDDMMAVRFDVLSDYCCVVMPTFTQRPTEWVAYVCISLKVSVTDRDTVPTLFDREDLFEGDGWMYFALI